MQHVIMLQLSNILFPGSLPNVYINSPNPKKTQKALPDSPQNTKKPTHNPNNNDEKKWGKQNLAVKHLLLLRTDNYKR